MPLIQQSIDHWNDGIKSAYRETISPPLTDEAGTRHFVIELLATDLVRIDGVNDRDQAARLTGTKLYVPREALPPPEDPDEFYLSDLEGVAAFTPEGVSLGRVRAVEDHGAGAFLVLEGPRERLIPFTRASVPSVDLGSGRIVVIPPAEVIAEPSEGAA